MNWGDQNTSGIAWNQMCESMRKMWAVYHTMAEGDSKRKMHDTIIDITNKFIKISGVIGD